MSRNSAGSAEAENTKYLNSIQGKLDQFQAKWESFSVSLADSSGLKAIIDLGGSVISVLDGMTKAFGPLSMIALPFVATMSKMGNIGKLKYALLWRANTSHRMMAAQSPAMINP